MGIRNLTCVMQDGEYKIAQYGQWDGYPSGQGVDILSFLQNADLEKFREKIKTVRFLKDEEIESLGIYWKDKYPQLSRDHGAKVLDFVINDTKIFQNSISFAGDSLFCEYCYVVDLDKNTFEVFEGFNKKPIKEGRFVTGDSSLDGQNEEGSEYEPVKLIKIYNLNSLPSEEEFLTDLEPQEEGE